MLNALLLLLAIFSLGACSPSGENLSPLDIQKGSSSPYDIEATSVCVYEVGANRRACPQQVLGANVDKGVACYYTNVGMATIPKGAVVLVVRIDGKAVWSFVSRHPMEPGKRQGSGSGNPSDFRRADKGAGTYEVMLEVKLSNDYEEANTDDNVFVQMVEVRE